MKVIVSLLLLIAAFGLTLADTPAYIYLRIEPVIGDYAPLADAGVMAGCYIGPGKECNGLFYMKDDGSGVLVGTIINDLVPEPDFELLYSITLTKEAGRDMLVGSAYAMRLSPEGEILSGRRTEIRQYLTYGEDIVLVQPVGLSEDGETIYLQMRAGKEKPIRADQPAKAGITLISTQLADGRQYSQVTNWYDHLKSARFRAGFSSKEKNGTYEFLKYEVEIDVDCEIDIDSSFATDLVNEPLRGKLSFSRRYLIDTLHYRHASFSTDLAYTSEYKRDIEIVPGKMLKLIFPPDTPSVRGFDIEDTLIIIPQ